MMEDCFDTQTNPFEISVEDKDEYTNDDFLSIQEKLREKSADIDKLLDSLYPKDRQFNTPFELIRHRCRRGIERKLIDIENSVLPTRTLFTCGTGGENCFVCCTPVLNDRYYSSLSMYKSLEEVGFNGQFLLFQGGFPTPTGTEMKYAGVPYCFKIFMMLEAKKLGFKKIIWIDSACYAVNNPQRLFDILDEDDAIFRSFPAGLFETYNNTVFPKTIQLLDTQTNKDITKDENICSIVIGFNFHSPKINEFVKEYYEMVKLGLPFLSYFPEEVVFTVILNKPEYKHVFYHRSESDKLFIHETYINAQRAKECGYYFLQRIHRIPDNAPNPETASAST